MYLPGAWQLVFTKKTFFWFHLGILLGILRSSGMNSRMNLPWTWNTKTHDAVAWGGSCWQATSGSFTFSAESIFGTSAMNFSKSSRIPNEESSEHLAGWYTRKKGGDQGAAPDKANQFMLFNDQSLSQRKPHECWKIPFTQRDSHENKKAQAPIRVYQQLVEDIPSWGLTASPEGNQQKWSSHWGSDPAPKKAKDHHVSRSMPQHDGQGDASSQPSPSASPQCWALCNGVLISCEIELRLALDSAASLPHRCRGSLSWKGKYFRKCLPARIVVVKLSVHNTPKRMILWHIDCSSFL